MNELTDVTIVRGIAIELQKLILSQINSSIESLKTICNDSEESFEISIILYELKQEVISSELKKVVDNLIFFVNNDESYKGEDVIKSLILIRDGIYEKLRKLIIINKGN